MPLTALALNCSLKSSPEESSTELLAGQLLAELDRRGIPGEQVRLADLAIAHSVLADADAGDEDQWPSVREKIHAADVLVLATPIWNGQPSSIAAKVYERLNAELSYLDDAGRTPLFGKVVVCVVVGNEDGNYHVAGITHQVFTDMGATVPPQPILYWHGPSGGSSDYKDLDEMPDNVSKVLPMLASNAAHLAGLLANNPYPGVPS